MYGPIEAGRVSVRDHMDRLKAEIGSFEADLRLLQTELERPGEAGPPAPSGSVP